MSGDGEALVRSAFLKLGVATPWEGRSSDV